MILADIQDATDRKRLEQKATRLRDELIATVSHELRTPLTSIIGYTELLADLGEADISAQARPMLEVIERNALRELKLVEDLLTLAFYDEERLRLALGPLDLAELAHDVVEDQQLRAQETGVALTLDGNGFARARAGRPLPTLGGPGQPGQQRAEVHSRWRERAGTRRQRGTDGEAGGSRHRNRNRR